jgi:hypothetical protein
MCCFGLSTLAGWKWLTQIPVEKFVQMVSVAPLYPFLALLAYDLRINLSHLEICELPAYLLEIQARPSATLTKLLLVFCKVNLVQHEAYTRSNGQRVFVGGESRGDDSGSIQSVANAKQRQSNHLANLMNPSAAELFAH